MADNTPIVINGVPAPEVGVRGLYFLIAGDGGNFPHHAVTNHQARLLLDGTKVRALTKDELGQEFETLSIDQVVERLSPS